MKTQFDSKVRVVAVENLRAMCARVSGVCHRYSVTKVSRSRVHVTYSNPNEYGSESPMVAIFPCYPNHFDREDGNPMVVLECMRILYDNWGGEGYQAFDIVRDCPTLWRSPADGKWTTEEERQPKEQIGDCDGAALKAMRERGGTWYAYENADLSSANVGHVQFLKVGSGCTFETAPDQYPSDNENGLGWRYRLRGPVNLDTGYVAGPMGGRFESKGAE